MNSGKLLNAVFLIFLAGSFGAGVVRAAVDDPRGAASRSRARRAAPAATRRRGTLSVGKPTDAG